MSEFIANLKAANFMMMLYCVVTQGATQYIYIGGFCIVESLQNEKPATA